MFSPSADYNSSIKQVLDLLFGPLYDEFFNDGTSRVNKSSSPTDSSIKKDTLPLTHIQPTLEPTSLTNVHAEENNDNQAEFTNPFCTPVQENSESSSRNIGTSNMHTFNQPQDSEYRWTKDHPLTQVRSNQSKPVQTRRQLAIDPEMYMFALTDEVLISDNNLLVLIIGRLSGERCMFNQLDGFVVLISESLPSKESSIWIKNKFESPGVKFSLLDVKRSKIVLKCIREDDYVALSASCAQVMWHVDTASRFGFQLQQINVVLALNQSLSILCNPLQQSHTKRIPYSYHSSRKAGTASVPADALCTNQGQSAGTLDGAAALDTLY
ncbi:hypothetical protein Tco_0330835 [Tanacetum coccineum]